MSENAEQIPASSQTVGPYFRIGLDYLIDRTPAPGASLEETVEIRGRVLDRDGVPVPDAMLEFWSGAGVGPSVDGNEAAGGIPGSFRRVATDESGAYSLVIERPAAGTHLEPHFMVLVFARGLLRHLITRVYLGCMAGSDSDDAFVQVPPDRRATLIARADVKLAGLFWWDVVLQGTNETVFFAW